MTLFNLGSVLSWLLCGSEAIHPVWLVWLCVAKCGSMAIIVCMTVCVQWLSSIVKYCIK